MSIGLTILLAISGACMMLYVIMLGWAMTGWKQLPRATEPPGPLQISIIVAARNEEENIRTVLHHLTEQKTEGIDFEIIVVDDHSTDRTLELARDLALRSDKIKVLTNTMGEGKKAALQTGVMASEHPILATVDADCRIPEHWLHTMSSFWHPDSTKMVLGPVVFAPTTSLLEKIQSLEMLAIMGLTGGPVAHHRPLMANGANLMVERTALQSVGGYQNDENPSGDDVFTMLRIHDRWPGSIAFAKDHRALVYTAPQPDLLSFWQQRKRWLSKKGDYTSAWVKTSAMITYLSNLTALICLSMALILFGSEASQLLLWPVAIKTIADLALTRTVKHDLLPDCGIWHILPAELFIMVYVSLLGIFGNVKKYVWKGRTVNLNNS